MDVAYQKSSRSVATLVLYYCRFPPSLAVLILSAAIAVMTPFLRAKVGYAVDWGGSFRGNSYTSVAYPRLLFEPVAAPGDEYNDAVLVPHDLNASFKGVLLSYYFPFFPFMMFPLVGLVLGRRVVEQRNAGELLPLAAIGIALVILGLDGAYCSRWLTPGASLSSNYISPLSLSPDSFTMMLVQLGWVLALFSVFFFFVYDLMPRGPSQRGEGRAAYYYLQGLLTRAVRAAAIA